MKKKIFILVILLIGLLTCAYFYVYQDHKDVAAASADFTISVADLQREFMENDSLATLKYQDKVVELSGIITAVEVPSKSIVIDEKLFAVFDAAIPSEVKNKDKVTIKGRFLGYDELLEEFKIDQVSLVK
jgi:tRNA_anti-like